MTQIEVETELRWRFYCWAKKFIEREIAEDFPALRACDLNRRVKCFLAWVNNLNEKEKLPLCLSLVRRANQRHLVGKSEEFTALDKKMLESHGDAHNRYHHILPPTPDCDCYSPKFIKADIKKCRDAIVEQLNPICGKPMRRQLQKLWYKTQFGDWTFLTHIEIRRLLGPTVECYSFLWRSDFKRETFPEIRIYAADLSVRLDPLIITGVSWSQFPLIGHSHEQLAAQSVRASIEMLLPSISKLVEGLGIDD
jgi:hypothetical protein